MSAPLSLERRPAAVRNRSPGFTDSPRASSSIAMFPVIQLFLTSSLLTQAGDWPQFRGPGGLAVAADTPIPTSFGPDAKVLWKTKLPPGHSSPCILGARV